MSDVPWEATTTAEGRKFDKPTMLVDVRRCIGCHACSVACKVEHNVPLGEFRMRVRWLPRPDRAGISFLPLFDANACDFGANRGDVGLDPACVTACPTDALRFGDASDAASTVAKISKAAGATPLRTTVKTKSDVVYIGQEAWHGKAINDGVKLNKADTDITYEQ